MALCFGAAMLGDHDVLEDRHMGEQSHVLERAGDASCGHLVGIQADDRLPLENDVAGRGRHHGADGVEQSGLAGAVGADDRDDLAGVHLHRQAVQGLEATELDLEVADLQQRPTGLVHC